MRALVEAARDPNFAAKIVLVLADTPSAPGLHLADEAGIVARTVDYKAFSGKAAFEAAVESRLRDAGIELICLAGFMRVLSPAFVDRWRNRILNVHPSLLPDLRGLHTHERVLAEGRNEHGCTVHYVSAELDAGPILLQARVPVLPTDDAAALAARVLAEEHRIYPLALDRAARALRTKAAACDVNPLGWDGKLPQNRDGAV